MTRPPKLSLAHVPTPVERMDRLSAELGLELFVKRDDLTGSHLTGNKVRKLDYLLAGARDAGATHVITCGGIQSNHARATALAAAPLGMKPVLLLRTARGLPEDLPSSPEGNVLLDLLAGAEIRLCDPAGYADRERRMALLARELEASGGRPYVVPEGGSNELGALGYVDCAAEIATQIDPPPSSVVVATGSGGTLAGLAIGLRALQLPTRAVGVAVCDDAPTFRAIVDRIAARSTRSFGTPSISDEDYDVVEGYKGAGYGISSEGDLALLRATCRRDGLVLDPVYTVKAFRALVDLARRAPKLLGGRVVFVHTGGLPGLFPRGAELAPLLGAP